MCKEIHNTYFISVLLLICIHIRTLCEAKIEVIQKHSKDVIYTIYEKDYTSNCPFTSTENNKTYVVASYPIDTCEDVRPPPQIDLVDTRKTSNLLRENSKTSNEITWSLLSRISTCDLKVLIENAKNLGYSSLILYGDTEDTNIQSSIAGIPIFFISEDDGNHLREKYSYPKRFFVHFTEPAPWYTRVNEVYNLTITAILAILTHWTVQCFVYGLLLAIFFCRLLGYRFGFSVELRGVRMNVTLFSQSDNSDNDEGGMYTMDELSPPWIVRNLRNVPMRDVDRVRLLNQLLPNRRIIRLSTLEWQPQEGKDDVCPICLDHYTPKETLSSLPCNHYFHKRCIQTWLRSGRQMCPLCRHPVDQLLREYNPGLNNPDWIQERHDRLRDTWYNLTW